MNYRIFVREVGGEMALQDVEGHPIKGLDCRGFSFAVRKEVIPNGKSYGRDRTRWVVDDYSCGAMVCEGNTRKEALEKLGTILADESKIEKMKEGRAKYGLILLDWALREEDANTPTGAEEEAGSGDEEAEQEVEQA